VVLMGLVGGWGVGPLEAEKEEEGVERLLVVAVAAGVVGEEAEVGGWWWLEGGVMGADERGEGRRRRVSGIAGNGGVGVGCVVLCD
jgi:hypothetical protein